MNAISLLQVSLFATVFGALAGPATAQNLESTIRSQAPQVWVGNNDVGLGLQPALTARRSRATFPGMAFRPTQQSVSASVIATATVLGQRLRPAEIYLTAHTRDGTWTTSTNPATGQPMASNYVAGTAAGMYVNCRVGGLTLPTFPQVSSASASFSGSMDLPIAGFASPGFSWFGFEFRLAGRVVAHGEYAGGVTLSPRSTRLVSWAPYLLHIAPRIGASFSAMGEARGELGITVDAWVAEFRSTLDARLGTTRVSTSVSTTDLAVSGSIQYGFDPLRLLAQVRFRLGVCPFCTSYTRTLYDHAVAGYSNTVTLPL